MCIGRPTGWRAGRAVYRADARADRSATWSDAPVLAVRTGPIGPAAADSRCSRRAPARGGGGGRRPVPSVGTSRARSTSRPSSGAGST